MRRAVSVLSLVVVVAAPCAGVPALRELGITPGQAATRSTVGGAAIGTPMGTALGAAIGAAAGSPATGAAIGAGGGLLMGTAAGASAGDRSYVSAQRRYDIAYQPCMCAKGNQILGVIAA